MPLDVPKRTDLQQFIKDDRTLRAFEELFNSLILEPGDVVYSAAATRNGALLMDGSAVSRALYADLFNAIGTTYGAGDGSTTFNLPDALGRVIASKENSPATRLTVAGCGIDGAVLGAAGGLQSATAPLPAHTHGFSAVQNAGGTILGAGAAFAVSTVAGTTGSTGSGTGGHANVQPTLVLNAFIIY